MHERLCKYRIHNGTCTSPTCVLLPPTINLPTPPTSSPFPDNIIIIIAHID